MTAIKYILSLLVFYLSINIFLWAKFSDLWLPPAFMKNMLTKTIELNINKTNEMKNSIRKIKEKTRMSFLYAQQS